MNKHQVKWKVVETPVDVYYCGLGVAKNATGLKDWLNVAIFDLHKSGKSARYGRSGSASTCCSRPASARASDGPLPSPSGRGMPSSRSAVTALVLR